MPSAAVPFCPVPGCSQRSRGPCRQHRAAKHQATDARRGTTDERGYTRRWKHFIVAFRQQLLARHILPTCGARLTGTASPHSHCAAQGRLTLEGLHVDHEPPLEDWERQRPERVCDPQRVQLLCAACHSRKTRQELREQS